MPVTMTRPWQARQMRQARAKRGVEPRHERRDGPRLDLERAPCRAADQRGWIGLDAAAFMRRIIPPHHAKLALDHSSSSPMTPEHVAELIRAGLPGAERARRVRRQHPFRRADRRRASSRASAPIARHQLVYRTLGELMGREIHALSIEALTPDEAGAATHPTTDSSTWTSCRSTAACRSKARCASRARRTRRCRSSRARCSPTEPVTIGNVPHLQDVTTTIELLGRMGVTRHHRRAHAHRGRRLDASTRMLRAVRAGEDHARVDPRARPAGGALRQGRRVAARRLRHRRAAR